MLALHMLQVAVLLYVVLKVKYLHTKDRVSELLLYHVSSYYAVQSRFSKNYGMEYVSVKWISNVLLVLTLDPIP